MGKVAVSEYRFGMVAWVPIAMMFLSFQTTNHLLADAFIPMPTPNSFPTSKQFHSNTFFLKDTPSVSSMYSIFSRQRNTKLFLFDNSNSNRNRSMNDAYKRLAQRKNVQIPLFIQPFQNNDNDNDNDNNKGTVVLPLPSSHLPTELSTLNMYTLTIQSPAQKLLLEEAQRSAASSSSSNFFMGQSVGLYGHILTPNPYLESSNNVNVNTVNTDTEDTMEQDDTGLVGLIGCAAEILITASPIQDMEEDRSLEDEKPVQVLTRGSFRFVIKEIISTIPYPIAIVDELVDDEDDGDGNSDGDEYSMGNTPIEYNDFDDHDDDDDEFDEDNDYDELSLYQTLPASELNSRTLQAMQAYIQLRLTTEPTQFNPPSPIEQQIMNNAGLSPMDADTHPTRASSDEMAAIFSVLQQELVEMNSIQERRYAISFLAAEMTSPSLTNAQRLQILSTKNSIYRMRLILQRLETNISMERAKFMANELTKDADRKEGFEDSGLVPGDGQELKVGNPGLPKWADQLTTGMRIEYFWNEEFGWCEGIIEEKVKILDEVIVTVRFVEDGEVHKLPVTADDKIRWRPAQS